MARDRSKVVGGPLDGAEVGWIPDVVVARFGSEEGRLAVYRRAGEVYVFERTAGAEELERAPRAGHGEADQLP